MGDPLAADWARRVLRISVNGVPTPCQGGNQAHLYFGGRRAKLARRLPTRKSSQAVQSNIEFCGVARASAGCRTLRRRLGASKA
jgi:hypothetical protein